MPTDPLGAPEDCDVNCSEKIQDYLSGLHNLTIPEPEPDTDTQTDSDTPTSTETDTDSDTQVEVELTADELAGKNLYDQMCATCHADLGDGGLKDLRPSLREDTFNAITIATMPKEPLGAPADCDEACSNSIEAYLLKIHNITVMVPEEPVPALPEEPIVVMAINTGSASGYTAHDHTQFIPDEYFTGGTLGDGALRETMNTEEDLVFSSERWGEFSYEIPLDNGHYMVEFWFAELFHEEANARVFNVNIEGTQSITGLDIFATSGGKNSAYISDRFSTFLPHHPF